MTQRKRDTKADLNEFRQAANGRAATQKPSPAKRPMKGLITEVRAARAADVARGSSWQVAVKAEPSRGRAGNKPTTATKRKGIDIELFGHSLYSKMLEQFDDDEDGFYEWLREHRLEEPSVCLGYYLQRARREMNLTNSDVAERTKTASEPPLSRSYISAILAGRSSSRADTWVRIAYAVDANPLEFFIAEGWIDPGDIAAYQVPHSALLLQVAKTVEHIQPGFRGAFVSMVQAVADTVIAQQKMQAQQSTMRAEPGRGRR